MLQDLPEPDETPIPQIAAPGDLTTASILLTLLDGIVQMAVGPQYGMNKEERKMIGEPLDRIMARFPVSQIAQIGPFVDPLLVLMGLVAWGSRISRMKRETASSGKSDKAVNSPGQEATPIPEQAPLEPVTPYPYPPEEVMSVPPTLGIGLMPV